MKNNMPVSKLSKRSARNEIASYAAPASISAPKLLRAGDDRAFQKLVFDLFTISARIERVRAHFASQEGISGPQYSVLRAVASLQGNDGVSIGVVAEQLQVTSPFVAAQSGLLTRLGFLRKVEDTSDRRISRLSLSPKGQKLVDRIVEGVRPVNDAFFGRLERSEFIALSTIMAKLVDSSRKAVHQIAPTGSADCPTE
jgi:DNA-binding MarR family transcriptional regulator